MRLFGERERAVRDLRPFLLTPSNLAIVNGADPQGSPPLRAPFDSLCENVLNVRVAYLCPVVPFASPLAYPPRLSAPVRAAAALASRLSPEVLSLAIAPERFQEAEWAIPLWEERGLAGVLLLGERNDGGLYSQEEIEIAQATGERVLEAQASAELTRRLIDLQRGRLAATQVIDRRGAASCMTIFCPGSTPRSSGCILSASPPTRTGCRILWLNYRMCIAGFPNSYARCPRVAHRK